MTELLRAPAHSNLVMSTHSLRLPWRKTPSNPVSLSEPGPAGVLWRCLTYLRPYWRKTLGAYLMLAAINVLALTGRAFLRLADAGILSVGSAAVLIWMNPRLALLALATLPFLAQRALYLGRRLRPLSLGVQQQLAVLTTRLEQNLRGARVVRSFAQEDAEIARFDQENDRWFNLSVRSSRLEAINTPLMDLIANISTVIIIWYGGRLVVQGQLTLGELVAFTTYLAQLASPVRRLGQIV